MEKSSPLAFRQTGGTPVFGAQGLPAITPKNPGHIQAFLGDGTGTGPDYGAPQPGGFNRFTFVLKPFRGLYPEITSADIRANIDLDQMVDDFVGFSDGGDYSPTSGLFRWSLKSTGSSSEHPIMYIDPTELGTRFPSLVDWTYDNSAFRVIEDLDENGEVEAIDAS